MGGGAIGFRFVNLVGKGCRDTKLGMNLGLLGKCGFRRLTFETLWHAQRRLWCTWRGYGLILPFDRICQRLIRRWLLDHFLHLEFLGLVCWRFGSGFSRFLKLVF